MGYLTNFIVYTLAMIGIIMLALFVFKFTTGYKLNNKTGSKNLKVTESLSLSPRKTLYVVEANGEKFLIAGDTDRTTLISKLEAHSNEVLKNIPQTKKNDASGLEICSMQKSPYESVVKNIARKTNAAFNEGLSVRNW